MPRLISRRTFLATTVTAPVVAGLYAWRVEPTWVEFFERELPIRKLPAALVGKRLVQVSDLHIGPQVDDDYLIDTFKRIAALNPDIVVHTGDLVTYHGPNIIEQARRVMAHFPHGTLGTVGVLGNHDYGFKWADLAAADKIATVLRNSGIAVLRNEHLDVAGLRILGLDDMWANRHSIGQTLRGLDPQQPALMLSHNPDTCDLDGWGNYRGWILSGHTHGGQCKPPFLPAPLLPVKNRRYTAGEFALTNDRRLYINRGLGHLLRVRFNVRPEVTVFKLTAA